MPKSISTFRNASRSHFAVKPNSNHVWISEDVLAQTFNTFAHNHRRHGSNVPGPLEARRRASKRRATHLAYSSAGNYNAESFGLFDSRPQQGWWQKEGVQIEQHPSSWQWASIFQVFHGGLPQPPPPPSLPVQYGKPEKLESDRELLSTKSIQAKLDHNIRRTRTHAALIDVLSELSINIRQTPRLARMTLKRMLADQWDYSEIAEYLLDPRTNTTGTSNHVYIFKNSRRHLELFTWLVEQDVFVKAARLGLLEVADLQRILLVSLTIKSFFPQNMDWACFSIQLLNAIKLSQVLGLTDLGIAFAQRWLKNIVQQSFRPAVPELLWRLHKSVGLSDAQALESTIHGSLSMLKGRSMCHLHALVKFLLSQSHELVSSSVFRLTHHFVEEARQNTSASTSSSKRWHEVDWLFRKEILRQARGSGGPPIDSYGGVGSSHDDRWLPIPHMSPPPSENSLAPPSPADPEIESLVQQRLFHITKLELWYAVLAELGYAQMDHFEVYMGAFRSFADSSLGRNDAKQQSLTAFWVLMALCIHRMAPLEHAQIPHAIVTELRRKFSPRAETGEEILVSVQRALKLSPLPAKNKLFRRLSTLSGKYLGVKQNYWTLEQNFINLIDPQISTLLDDKVHRSMKHHFPARLTRLAECLNNDMAKFEDTCISMIAHVKGSPGIVFALLDHNERIKLSLRRAGMLMRSNPSNLKTVEAMSMPAFGGYTYRRLLDMIHNIAQAFASSEQMTPRTALRGVLQIKKFLRQCEAPVEAPIGRMMWYAGITRPKTVGREPCYQHVQYLYGEVVKLEGETTARQLLQEVSNSKYASLCEGQIPAAVNPLTKRSTGAPALLQGSVEPHSRKTSGSALSRPNSDDHISVLPFNAMNGAKSTTEVILSRKGLNEAEQKRSKNAHD